jgi:hypothetical protein
MTKKKRLSRNLKLWMIQRAIMLQLLRDDHDPLWTRGELEAEVSDFGPRLLRVALELLEGDCCIVLDGEEGVRASTCAHRLDELELVAI